MVEVRPPAADVGAVSVFVSRVSRLLHPDAIAYGSPTAAQAADRTAFDGTAGPPPNLREHTDLPSMSHGLRADPCGRELQPPGYR